jgi:hypothetical protein
MIVSITRLHLRSARYLLPFVVYALRSARQAKRSAGNVASDQLRDRRGGFWTRTVWADEASLRAFMSAGAHRKAMPKLLDWCDEAAVVRWEQESPALPAWDEAHRRLVTAGRRSKVRHPSPAHDALDIPPPRRPG